MALDAEDMVPVPTIRRLPLYLQYLRTLDAKGRDIVSCTFIAKALSFTDTQVRKDLSYTGLGGKPKVGYAIKELIASIEDFLGWNNTRDAFLVGAGSLGMALLGYDGFRDHGLNLVAAFDVDPEKIGATIRGRQVFHISKILDLAARLHVKIVVLATPESKAQEAADLSIMAGIQAIWNFTPATLVCPGEIIVEDVRLYGSLAALTSRLKQAVETIKPVVQEE